MPGASAPEHPSRPLRIGLIGAARIAKAGIIDPVAAEPRAVLQSVAARDPDRAAAFAAANGFVRADADYEALIAADDIDLVYVATPPSHHAALALAAIAAGKHVLVEKPFAMDAEEASRIVDAANSAGVHAFEAMHAPHHPLFKRIAGIVEAGEIGAVREIESRFDVPIGRAPGEFRWRADMGGGALMDLGVYPLAFCRRLLGEPATVLSAAHVPDNGVDAAFWARPEFAGGATALIGASMTDPVQSFLRVTGTHGTLLAENPVVPHRGHRLVIEINGEAERVETVPGPTSWTAMLHAICDTLLDGRPFSTGPADPLLSMQAVDRIRCAFAKFD